MYMHMYDPPVSDFSGYLFHQVSDRPTTNELSVLLRTFANVRPVEGPV